MTTIEGLIGECFDELQLDQHFAAYAQRAEAAGLPGLARVFRALAASETARAALLRRGALSHAHSSEPYFVCPE